VKVQEGYSVSTLEKIKNWLEWLHLGKVLYEVLAGIASLAAVKSLMVHVFHLPSDTAYSAGFFVAALVVFALVRWRERKSQQGQSAQNATNTNTLMASAGKFDATAYLRAAYVSALRSEIESNVRTAALQTRPNDREGFYVDVIASGLPSFMHDLTWAYIFRSQLLLLSELNRGLVPIAKAREYYDNAAAENPKPYAKYSFTKWLEFMKSHFLIIIHTKDAMIEGTVRGRDFLKYLVHCGRSADDRFN
jgi:hypothetical protein